MTTNISPQPKLQFLDSSGVPLSGGKVYTYAAGTTTPAVTYTDYTGNTANSNPIILDSRGECSIWLGTSLYKIRLDNASNVTIWTVDNIGGAATLANLAASGGSSLIGFLQAGTGAQTRTVQSKLRDVVSVKDFGATGNGLTDDTSAIKTAILAVKNAGGGDVIFPQGTYKVSATLQGADGVRLVGASATNRWRSARTGVVINYTGSGSAVAVTPSASVGIDSFQMYGIELNGSSSSAGTNGLFLNAVASNSYIEGCLFENCTFRDFPANQINHTGTAFDITYRHCTVMNPSRASSHLVYIVASGADLPSQITFDDCWFAPYTASTWAVYAAQCNDLRFINGTVAPYVAGATGAYGVICSGGLTILGTHFENADNVSTTNIGIQYIGSNGAYIAPSTCALFGRGVMIGDGTSSAARGWTVAGSVGNNNSIDLLVTNGGSRTGTILQMGFSDGTPVITNNRKDIDGISEVLYANDGKISQVPVSASAGTAAAPSFSFVSGTNRGFYDAGSGVGVTSGGVQTAEFRDIDVRLSSRFLPGTPAGVFQSSLGIYGGTGVPSNSNGVNGDIYFNSTGGSGTTMYQKRAGAWVGIV
jgi:hypothetical protein